MGILSNLIGFRWSLYIVRNENELVYVMHENSVIRIVGYVMKYYKNNSTPNSPWSLHLNFNKKHKSFKLEPEHFAPDGENITNKLIKTIETIDPGYRVSGGDPVFMNAKTKQSIKLSQGFDLKSIQERLDNLSKPREITFFSIMDEIFEKSA